MNTFLNNLQESTNFHYTENGGLVHKKLENQVYQLFALGAAYRTRSDEDCILLFKNAYEENPTLALKCLFWLRDVRGGAGERRFFRVCFKWLANAHPEAAARNLINVEEYGRYDDLIYSCMDTKVEKEMLKIICDQFELDMTSKTPSLMGKWLPSENASSPVTKKMATRIREYLGMSHKEYRKTLSALREKIKVIERLMSANRWDEIEFESVPSKAGLIYRNAFVRRDILAQRYKEFIESDNTKVNARALYPYEIIAKAVDSLQTYYSWGGVSSNTKSKLTDLERKTLEKYWNNLENPFENNNGISNIMCVCDTSGSMRGINANAPINVAIALSMLCAERAGGAFKNHYISFSSHPQLIKIEGVDFVDKVARIYQTNLCQNTDLMAVFELLRNTAIKSDPKDVPDTVVILSDMEIDNGATYGWGEEVRTKLLTDMEKERIRWQQCGLVLPRLVYWNINAQHDNFLDDGPNVTYVSGASQNTFEGILKGKTGWDLCLDKLLSPRYEAVS